MAEGGNRFVLSQLKKDWWQSAVFYQIYPKSFQDSNGDGIGDLRGIINRLDYLENLGIDGIWMSPVLASPQVDNGYDISDYQNIDPMFGTMEDMEELIAEAEKRGIVIILDLVLNHSSNEHVWFQEAKKSKKNPYHDYYIWRDGSEDTLPNDMRACFGGPAWTWVPELGQYYFHQFAVEQPDLNWENPALREELYRMIRFWVDKGIKGFRLDVIDQIAKEPDRGITNNGPHLHEFLRELSAKAFCEEYLVTVGEAWGADVERAKLYSAPDCSELSMVFQFEHIGLDQEPGKDKWDMIPLPLVKLKKTMEKWQQGLQGKGWNSLFMNNHDLPRIVSRWGDDTNYRVPSAKMLGAMLHGMQGTPYIYQGEELGMTNIRLSIEEYADIEIKNLYSERLAKGYPREEVLASIYGRGRDNARTMMQWSDEENAGFSTGTPWFAVNPNYKEINAAKALADPDSVFYFYQKLIALRKALPVFRLGNFELIDPENEKVFAYRRSTPAEQLTVICNFTAETLDFGMEGDPGELLLGSYPGESEQLRPYEARYYYKKKPGYRDYIFDFYGTLVEIRTNEDKPALWEALAREYCKEGISGDPSALRLEYQELVQKEIARAAAETKNPDPEIKLEKVFAALLHRADITEESPLVWELGARFRELSMEYIYPFPGVHEMLGALKEKGGRVWLLSNAQRIFTAAEIDRAGLTEYFDGIYISSDEGVKKPDPEFYRTLLTEQKIDPRDAVMIGNDMNCDIRGAKRVGLHTLYMRSATSPELDPSDAEFAVLEPDMDRICQLLMGKETL